MENDMVSNFYRRLSKLNSKLTRNSGGPGTKMGMLSSPVLVNSIPKSGTNLLKNIILALPNATFVEDMSLASNVEEPRERLELVKERIRDLSPGSVYTGHIPHSPALVDWIHQQGIKQVFIYRDPRDITVSLYHYIMMESTPRHAYYELYANLGSDSERLFGSICGIGEGRTKYKLSPFSIPNIKIAFDAYEQWLSDENTFALRYENLMESGNDIDITEKMLSFLGVPFDEALANVILSRGKDPGKSHTFRRGGSGAWRDEYSEQHIEAFKLVAGDLLDRWGYTWE